MHAATNEAKGAFGFFFLHGHAALENAAPLQLETGLPFSVLQAENSWLLQNYDWFKEFSEERIHLIMVQFSYTVQKCVVFFSSSSMIPAPYFR